MGEQSGTTRTLEGRFIADFCGFVDTLGALSDKEIVPEEDPHRTKISYLDQRVRQFGFLRCPKKGPNGHIRYWFDAFLGTRTISKPHFSAIVDV